MMGNIWQQYKKYPLGLAALVILLIFIFIGIYAPLFASSKPLIIEFEGVFYFPFFRYLLFQGFYTKPLDIFFNLLMFTLPLFSLSGLVFKNRLKLVCFIFIFCQLFLFFYFMKYPIKDPAFNSLKAESQVSKGFFASWYEEILFLTPYEKINLLIFAYNQKKENKVLSQYLSDEEMLRLLPKKMAEDKTKMLWIEANLKHFKVILPAFIRPYHWEDDTYGSSSINRKLPFFERTRINHKDLTAALIFGVRISLVVGTLSVLLSLLIGIPIGAWSGFYAGNIDIIICRILEIWEAMPTFFMLLLTVAITGSKSIFIIIAVLGFFGWTSIARFLRGEILKQRKLSYIEACSTLGFKDNYIIFKHLLPNSIAPVLTLMPFAIMAAITSEAGLSFLGLGEEGSASWGVLMDEGRSAFPAESYLLWPPAVLLTLLLVAIAIIGDTLRDVLDPRLKK
jgi:peptide/nickel transport system permease protein